MTEEVRLGDWIIWPNGHPNTVGSAKSGRRMPAEGELFQRWCNLGLITMGLKAIWEMSIKFEGISREHVRRSRQVLKTVVKYSTFNPMGTLKEATVRRYHSADHDKLRVHLNAFRMAYNHAKGSRHSKVPRHTNIHANAGRKNRSRSQKIQSISRRDQTPGQIAAGPRMR